MICDLHQSSITADDSPPPPPPPPLTTPVREIERSRQLVRRRNSTGTFMVVSTFRRCRVAAAFSLWYHNKLCQQQSVSIRAWVHLHKSSFSSSPLFQSPALGRNNAAEGTHRSFFENTVVFVQFSADNSHLDTLPIIVCRPSDGLRRSRTSHFLRRSGRDEKPCVAFQYACRRTLPMRASKMSRGRRIQF